MLYEKNKPTPSFSSLQRDYSDRLLADPTVVAKLKEQYEE